MRARGSGRKGPASRAGDGDRGFRNDVVAQAQRGGHADHGIAARRMAYLAIPEFRSGVRTWNMDRNKHFSWLERGGHDVDEEVPCRDTPASSRPGQLQF